MLKDLKAGRCHVGDEIYEEVEKELLFAFLQTPLKTGSTPQSRHLHNTKLRNALTMDSDQDVLRALRLRAIAQPDIPKILHEKVSTRLKKDNCGLPASELLQDLSKTAGTGLSQNYSETPPHLTEATVQYDEGTAKSTRTTKDSIPSDPNATHAPESALDTRIHSTEIDTGESSRHLVAVRSPRFTEATISPPDQRAPEQATVATPGAEGTLRREISFAANAKRKIDSTETEMLLKIVHGTGNSRNSAETARLYRKRNHALQSPDALGGLRKLKTVEGLMRKKLPLIRLESVKTELKKSLITLQKVILDPSKVGEALLPEANALFRAVNRPDDFAGLLHTNVRHPEALIEAFDSVQMSSDPLNSLRLIVLHCPSVSRGLRNLTCNNLRAARMDSTLYV